MFKMGKSLRVSRLVRYGIINLKDLNKVNFPGAIYEIKTSWNLRGPVD